MYFTNCGWFYRRSISPAILHLPELSHFQLDLDRSNINNAYVSGMKEELSMGGTDINARAPFNVKLLSTPDDIDPFISFSLSFSGVLQAAIYRHLNGHAGRSGWRWLFIIDGIITLPIAFYGFFVFPDVPAVTKAFYLSDEERSLATKRLEDDIQVLRLPPFSMDLAKRVLGRWRWWGCSLLFAISGETESLGSNNIMGQYLKAIGGYDVEQIDFYPSGATAVAIARGVLLGLGGTGRDKEGGGSGAIRGATFFAYYLAGASYAGQATTFAWANEICADDDQERAIVLASMNMWNNVINAWWPLVFYRASDAPRFRKGMIALICVSVATLGITWGVWWMGKRENNRKAHADSEKLEREHEKTEVGNDQVDDPDEKKEKSSTDRV
ncbi:hypothetical protein V5O48_000063 [Marasmius crinis-equi]|uniref:Uncharacterized protein n=1 Tax=Marasmius crinis-equi TaxID=585013 RepID=A0ABR3G3D7_9AGAR